MRKDAWWQNNQVCTLYPTQVLDVRHIPHSAKTEQGDTVLLWGRGVQVPTAPCKLHSHLLWKSEWSEGGPGLSFSTPWDASSAQVAVSGLM